MIRISFQRFSKLIKLFQYISHADGMIINGAHCDLAKEG